MISLISETIIGEDVLPRDDSDQLAVGRVHNHHVSAVVHSEPLQYLEEVIVDTDLLRVLDHVRPQVKPLLSVTPVHHDSLEHLGRICLL